MKGKISCYVPCCTINITLRIVIQEEWDVISPEGIASIVSSMAGCVEAVCTVDGRHTQY